MKKILTIVLCAFALYSWADEVKNCWEGKKVAFLGDSITDKNQLQRYSVYWNDLKDLLGIKPLVYGISGHRWEQIIGQAKKLKAEHGKDFSAIIIFIGTNDFNSAIPLGQWYRLEDQPAAMPNNKTEIRKRRIFVEDNSVRGPINKSMKFLKENFPEKQIILLTPIHRGWAKFSETNVQPDESFPNRIGLYIDDYVNVVKEAGNVWAVPVIDLNSLCGLSPNIEQQSFYFCDKKNDLLHPNGKGQLRMAKTLARQLLALPADFD